MEHAARAVGLEKQRVNSVYRIPLVAPRLGALCLYQPSEHLLQCFGIVGSYKAHGFDCCHLSGNFVAFPCERGAVGVEITAHTGLAYGMLHEALQRGARLVLMSGFHEYHSR